MGFHNYGVMIKDGIKRTAYLGRDDVISEGELIWGPDAAERFFARNVKEDDLDGNLIGYSDYGAAVVDFDNRIFLLFGGQLDGEIPLQRLYVELCEKTWPGWRVRYVYGGHLEICEYLNLYIERNHSSLYTYNTGFKPLSDDMILNCFTPICNKILEGVLSIKDDASTKIYHLYGCDSYDELILCGEKILMAAATFPALEECVVDPHGSNDSVQYFPIFGLHADLTYKTIGYWHSRPNCHRLAWVRECWPDWLVEFWGGAYEKQVKACNGNLQLLPEPREYYLNTIRRFATYDWSEQHHGSSAQRESLEKKFDQLVK